MKLTNEDLQKLIAWGETADIAGFGDNYFRKDDENRKLLNRIRRWQKKYDSVEVTGR